MKSLINICNAISTFIGGVLGWFLGGFDTLIYALIAFVSIDYITGVWLAVLEKKVSSDIGFKGISKKMMIFILVALGNIIDQLVIGNGSTLRCMLIMFYLSNEGISIIENAGKMGLPLPQKLKEALQQLNNTNREEKKEING